MKLLDETLLRNNFVFYVILLNTKVVKPSLYNNTKNF